MTSSTSIKERGKNLLVVVLPNSHPVNDKRFSTDKILVEVEVGGGGEEGRAFC